MTKICEYEGCTLSVGFKLEIYEDREAAEFRAVLDSWTPPLLPECEPGQPAPILQSNEPEEFRSKDLEELIEICKKRISDIGGEILRFAEIRRNG